MKKSITLKDFSPVRKLYALLILSFMKDESPVKSQTIIKPTELKTFAKSEKEKLEISIDTHIVEPHATMLKDLLASGYKPKTLELRVPIPSKRIFMIPLDPVLREKIEFLNFLKLSPEKISLEVSKGKQDEMYSPEDMSAYTHIFNNFDPQDGWESTYYKKLIEYFANSPFLRTYYKPLIDLTLGRIKPISVLERINSWDLIFQTTKRNLYSSLAESAYSMNLYIKSGDLSKALAHGQFIDKALVISKKFEELAPYDFSSDEEIPEFYIPDLIEPGSESRKK